ncbi:hypothetical protein BH11VER1_BH11VER1_41590 [soil metagenome]
MITAFSLFMNPLILSFLLSLTLFTANAQEKPWEFADFNGKTHTPLVVGDKKAVVLVFVSAYCPTANTFMPEINRIIAEYEKSFAFYLVHADATLKTEDVYRHAEMFEVKAPVLLDKEQRLAKLTKATITPEVVVLAGNGESIYQGRINDLYLGPTKKQRQATTKDLRDALDAVLAGKPVSNPKTDAVGCKITVPQ